MAKQSSVRTRRTKRRKKSDPTLLIISLVGAVFLLAFIVLYFSTTGDKVAKPKKRRAETPANQGTNARPQAAQTPAAKRERDTRPERKALPKTRPSDGRAVLDRTEIPIIDDTHLQRPKTVSTPEPQRQFAALPSTFTLPESVSEQHVLTDRVQFFDHDPCELTLHSPKYSNESKLTLTRTRPSENKWLLRLADKHPAIASIDLTDQGVLFKWDETTTAAQRALLHNAQITFSNQSQRETVQLRPIVKAPNIQLFGRDAKQTYSFDLKHAPSEIHWSLEPTDPKQDPFSFPTVGVPTTEGPIPITKSLEWIPENNTGSVKAKYVWTCATEPGTKSDERRIVITQTKEYKIGDAMWKPLTTESLRKDWDERLEKYDKVVAGIQRKILIGKYPSAKQINTLKHMVREGIAFADVRVFYYALPNRLMHVDFRTPCGSNDTLLAQYPARQLLGFRGMGGGGQPMGQGFKPFFPNSGASARSDRIDASRETHSGETSNAPETDNLWTMPSGEDPWKARQQNLEKISTGK